MTDRQGSLRALYNGSGLVQSFSYDAWGNRRNPGTGNALTTSELVTANSITARGYTCHEHMDEFGLINMNARIYDPSLGMFISVDPLAEEYYDTYPYAYCGGDPVNAVDPTGEAWYRYKDQNGNWIYEWKENINSQGDADGLGKDAEFIDFTHMDGDAYYSLFGNRLIKGTVEAMATQKLDEAIINYAFYTIDAISDPEAVQKVTDFDIGKYTRTSSLGLTEGLYFTFNYGTEESFGTAYYYLLPKGKSNKGTFESWTLSQKYMHNSNMGMGDMKDGYHIRFVRKGGSDRNWNARVVFDKKEDVEVLYNIFKNIRKYVRK